MANSTSALQKINRAKWIWVPGFDDTSDDAKFVLFRKTVSLDTLPLEPQSVRLSADTRYRLLVNGHRASFGPAKSYLTRWNFEEIDIQPFLRPGRNVVAVKVLRYSFAHAGNSSLIRGNIPGFILQGVIGDQTIDTDGSWRALEDKSIRIIPRSEWNFALGPPFLALNERCDLRRAERAWASTDYDDSRWVRAIVLSARSLMMPMLETRKLTPRTIPLLPEIEKEFERTVKHSGSIEESSWNLLLKRSGTVTIQPGNTEVVEIQSPVLTTGFLELVASGGAGSKITITCAESYEREHAPPRPGSIGADRYKGDRADSKNGTLYGPSDEYTLAEGDNLIEPFWFRTFRYIRLTFTAISQPLIVSSFLFRETHYPLPIGTKLKQTQDGLEEMWKISLNTMRNCMHETFEDCPYYEQNQFAMDTRAQILFVYQVSRDDRLARKTIHEFYASRREDGLVETHFPVPFRAINIPQFSLYWVLMVCDHFDYFADEAFVRKYLGTIDGVLEHFLARIGDMGLVGRFDEESWPFVDWVKEWHGKGGLQTMAIPPAYHQGDGIVVYNSLITALALQHAADLNASIGRDCVAREYQTKSRSLIDSVNKHAWNAEKKLYADGPSTPESFCQHSQVFAVLAGAISGEDASGLMRRTIDSTDLPKCSYAMSFYVLRAAAKTHIYEGYFDKLMRPWRKMMADNLTTWAEDDLMFRSDCHGWSSSPVYEIVHEIFGLSLADKGYRKVRIAPRFTLQREASGTFIIGKDTEGGDITLDIAWSNADEKLIVSASREVEATLVLRDGRARAVTLGSQPAVERI